MLRSDHISLHSAHSPDSTLEAGVIKIQRNEIDLLTDEEKQACSKLKQNTIPDNNSEEEIDKSKMTIAEI